jgi:hypothetical protein
MVGCRLILVEAKTVLYQDKPWDIFSPLQQQINKLRKSVFNVNMLMMDESMSGWRPKTSKLGGLPNCTYEPRKPVPLGTMFRNSVECITGCLQYQVVVQLPEIQHKGILRSAFFSSL